MVVGWELFFAVFLSFNVLAGSHSQPETSHPQPARMNISYRGGGEGGGDVLRVGVSVSP